MDDEIQKITNILIKEYQPERIILFGSYARGQASPTSDLDILIVSHYEEDLPRHQRGKQIRQKLASITHPLDLLFYTPQELKRFANVPQSFCATVQREGITLYER